MRRDQGSATIWLAGFTALVVLAAMAAVLPGSAVLARHHAAMAADLAALAGAVRVLDGPAVACATAGDIAARNGGSLARCAVSGEDVEVEVACPLILGGLGSWTARARARAGPADRAAATQ